MKLVALRAILLHSLILDLRCILYTCNKLCKVLLKEAMVTPQEEESQNRRIYRSLGFDAKSQKLLNGLIYFYRDLYRNDAEGNHPKMEMGILYFSVGNMFGL